LGPIAAARVGLIEGAFVLQPSAEQLKESKLDLVVAGTAEGVLMVESEAKELSEQTMLDAVVFGHKSFQPVIEAITRLKLAAGKQAWSVAAENPLYAKVQEAVSVAAKSALEAAYAIQSKQERYVAIDAARALTDGIAANFDDAQGLVDVAFEAMQSAILRGAILDKGTRVDGRSLNQVRSIVSEVGILPRTHGSALFTRGETQALVVTTLGTGQDEQLIDSLNGEYRERFMLHYNFPSYSVGEVGRVSGPGRREIGHGKLAWRAIAPMIPTKANFPYTIRTVSEITESNGSSSMATVCGASLSMMDAGVPLAKPVAGIAMGLIKEKAAFAVLSDILGDEDHLGDMDFKVAGTADGVTALQMDIKITSITPEIMQVALSQAKEGRLHILGEMSKAMTASRPTVSDNAPRLHSFSINREKIREVIGAGGKVIREICETTGAKIDITDEGMVTVAAHSQKSLDEAVATIMNIACDPEKGAIYNGTVVKIAEFGAFVNFMGSRDGLVHVSELADHRVAKVGDVVNVGDKVKVIVLGMDDRGKVKLSMKQVPNAAASTME
jgi:polyribonucleotide nucleotidyltransferase